MKTKGIIGQRIVEIRQTKHPADKEHNRPACVEVTHIVLENGTTLIPNVIEREDYYATEFLVIKKPRGGKAAPHA